MQKGFRDFIFVRFFILCILIKRPKEIENREIARKKHLHITDVDNVRFIYEAFDTDCSGKIEKNEFKVL